MSTPLKIIVTPNPALADEEVRIRIVGAPPRSPVQITAWMMDDQNRRWESRAEFLSRTDGTVVLSQDAPRSGTYRGVDPTGLFWSMRLNPGDAGQHDQYLKKELTPCEVTFEATTSAALGTARERLEKRFVPEGTLVRAVEEEGLAGLLFIPSTEERDREREFFDADGRPLSVAQSSLNASKTSPAASASAKESASAPVENGRLPAVITLGGSGGGLDWEVAAALAGHGYAGFALPYFGFDPLPASLNSIPLEYFDRAIAWLCRQPEIDPNRIGVYGISRGGELALLLASVNPLIRAVVGIVPGNVVWQGTGKPPEAIANGTVIPRAGSSPEESLFSSGSSSGVIPSEAEGSAFSATDNDAGRMPAPPGAGETPFEAQDKPALPKQAAKRASKNGARSSWTYRGEPVPFVPYAMAWFRVWTAVRVITMRKPVRFLDLHHDSLRHRKAVMAAGIPVEQIRAPILLVSAGDDAVWPSEAMSDAVLRRLESHEFQYATKHVKNKGAGHLLRLPHTPSTTLASKLANFDLRVAFGGNADATAQARIVAWRETLEFLQTHL